MVDAMSLEAPFGLKADGTPRKRKAGPGRPRLPISDVEKKERWRAARARWWRENRDKAARYREARRAKDAQIKNAWWSAIEKHKLDLKIYGNLPIRWFIPDYPYESHDMVGPILLPESDQEATKYLKYFISKCSDDNVKCVDGLSLSLRHHDIWVREAGGCCRT